MSNGIDQLELKRLEEERSHVIRDIISYVAGHVDMNELKYGCTLNRLVFKIRKCIDTYDLRDVIQPDMLNISSIIAGLMADGYLMDNIDSRGQYDCVVTKKGKKIGMGRYTTSDGMIKITVSSAAADMVIRNIQNGRYADVQTPYITRRKEYA